MKVYEDFRLAASGTRIYCPECGQSNPTDRETCEECGAPMLLPTHLFRNLLDVIIRPMQGMKRVAATAPLIQGLLVVVLTTTLQLIVRSLSVYQFWQYYFTNPDKIAVDFLKSDPNYLTLFAEGKVVSNAPELWQLLASLAVYVLSMFLFAGGMYLGIRFFYEKDASLNYMALLPIVAFSRVGYVGLLALAIVVLVSPEAASVVGIFSLLPLVWQLFLMIVGVRTSTGLSWNRSGIVVMIPALLFYFLVPIPF